MGLKAVSSAAMSMMFGPSVFAALVAVGMSLPKDVIETRYGLPDAGAAGGGADFHVYVPGLGDMWNPDTIASRLSSDVGDIDSTVDGWGNDQTSYVCRVDPMTGLAAGDDGTIAGITFNEMGLLDVLAQLRGDNPIGVFPFHLPPDALAEDGVDDGLEEALVAEVADDSVSEDFLLGFTFDPAFNEVDDQEADAVTGLLFEGLDISRVSDGGAAPSIGPGFIFRLTDTGFRFAGPGAGPGGPGGGSPFAPRGGGGFGPGGFGVGGGPGGFGVGGGPGGFGGGAPTLLSSVIPPELDSTPISFTADEDGVEGGVDDGPGPSGADAGAGGSAAAAVPEPWTAPLFGFAVLAMLAVRRRRNAGAHV